MRELKAMLERKGWVCVLCGPCQNKKADCLNNRYRDYMITITTTGGIAKIFMNGLVIAKVANVSLAAEMRKLNIYGENITA